MSQIARTALRFLPPLLSLSACLMLTAGCAPKHLPGLSRAETQVMAQGIRQQFAARRASLESARALADIHITAHGKEVLWKQFSAVFGWQSPDRFSVSGYGLFGEELFRYTSASGRYRFDLAGREAPFTGEVGDKARQPEARVLSALSHLLDGMLGPDLEGGRLRPARGGGWEIKKGGQTVRFRMAEGRVTHVEVPRSGAGPLTLAFSDFRTESTAQAPHHIAVSLPRLQAEAEIRVDEWAANQP